MTELKKKTALLPITGLHSWKVLVAKILLENGTELNDLRAERGRERERYIYSLSFVRNRDRWSRTWNRENARNPEFSSVIDSSREESAVGGRRPLARRVFKEFFLTPTDRESFVVWKIDFG